MNLLKLPKLSPTNEMNRPLKILLAGDASNFHPALAAGLRFHGHEVTIASGGCTKWMQTTRDIDLDRRFPGKIGGLDLWLRINTTLRSSLRGYDIVNIAGQDFIQLKTRRIKSIFDYLRANNRSLFYAAIATDWCYVENCFSSHPDLEYNDFFINQKPTPYLVEQPEIAKSWLYEPLRSFGQHIYSHIDGAVACLWEYELSLHHALPPDKIAYGGIPIETSKIKLVEMPDHIEKVKLLLGRHSKRGIVKGAEVLEAAARAVIDRYPDKAELIIVEDLPYDEYLERLRCSHVVLDQIYSYTPATTALLAMAMGLNTVSGGDERFYKFIGEDRLRPVIHVEPSYESVYRAIEQTVLHPEKIRPRGLEGREFVVKHNDAPTVAARNLSFWTRNIPNLQ